MDCVRYESPIGPLWLTGQDGTLTGLSFSVPDVEAVPGELDMVKHWLDS